MSAYICSNNTFAALAAFAAGFSNIRGLLRVDPRYLGDDQPLANVERHKLALTYAALLHAENAKSVAYRYREDADPTDLAELKQAIDQRHMAGAKSTLSAVDILKLCSCVEYQSCEHPEWPASLANALLDQIRKAAIRELPGYDEAPWGLPDADEYLLAKAS